MDIAFHPTIREIDPAEWNALIGDRYPFLDHGFLLALETSGSVGERTGWLPSFIAARDSRRLAGAMPLYRRLDSYGEYIFDWQWAEAYHVRGYDYYPKLTCAVPFTPATGPRLLIHPDSDRSLVAGALLTAARSLLDELNASSLHFLFIPDDEIPLYRQHGFSIRASVQFHWTNDGYASFDDFLARLKAKKRREIRRERQHLAGLPLTVRVLAGDAINAFHAELMYQFYVDTVSRKLGMPYLTREFFPTMFECMREHIVMIVAETGGEILAGALHFHKGDSLFGRYWGCRADVRHLHFELCYYRAIDYAIEHGLKTVEAGAQGSHKIQRGFSPVLTRSAHWIAHEGFRDAIDRHVAEEEEALTQAIAADADNFAYKAKRGLADGIPESGLNA